MGNERILVVEDDLIVMKVLKRALESEGYVVSLAPSSTAAMASARTARPDLMILDLNLIDRESFDSIRDGFGLLEWIRRSLPEANFPVLVHTVDDSPNVDWRARKMGVHGVLKKGRDIGKLLLAVREALDATQAGQPVSN
jgi:DNA-binding response OmpR family regulator